MHKYGDPDPTPGTGHSYCRQPCRPVGVCTWPLGHKGQHVAGDGEKVVGTTQNGPFIALQAIVLNDLH